MARATTILLGAVWATSLTHAANLGGTNVPKDRFVVWVFIGHSNMAGRALQSTRVSLSSQKVWKYNGSFDSPQAGKWTHAAEMISPWGNDGGPCMHFLQRVLEVHPESRYPDLHHGVINNGETQSTISYSNNAGNYYEKGGNKYDEIVKTINAVKNECTIAGVFVLLGYMEPDNSSFANQAAQMVADMRSAVGMPNLPFAFGDLEDSGGNAAVRYQIEKLPGMISRCARNTVRGPCGQSSGTDKDRCNGGDHHFNWYGYRAWGRACVDIVVNKGWFPVPTNTPPTVTITSPANGATYTAPASIAVQASASDSDGSVAKVEFFRGSTKLGEDTSSPYQYSWTGVAAGSYSLTVRATDNEGLTTTSAGVSITVQAPSNRPPVADAGSDQTAQVGKVVTLDASGSNDPDGDSLGYTWSKVSGPSTPDFSDLHAVTPHFTVPNVAEGTKIVFGLDVADGRGGRDADTVAVTVSSSAPPPVPLRDPDDPTDIVPGLEVDYYELSDPSVLPDFGALSPYLTDIVPAVDYPSTSAEFATSGRDDDVGAVFAGFIKVDQDGVYTFSTTSDDGSALYIGSTKVVDNDGLHGMTERSGQIGLRAGIHSLRVEFFDGGAGAGLVIRYAGPGVAAQVVPGSVLFGTGSTHTPTDPASSDDEVDDGSLGFGCAAGGGQPAAVAGAMATLALAAALVALPGLPRLRG